MHTHSSVGAARMGVVGRGRGRLTGRRAEVRRAQSASGGRMQSAARRAELRTEQKSVRLSGGKTHSALFETPATYVELLVQLYVQYPY